ncbi:MAG: protein-disulfide isomerase [Alphaproteobacteria bacterium]|jgi:protein-disulfide isomerase
MTLKIKILSSIIVATLLSGCLGGNTSDEKIAEIVEKTLNEKPEIIMNALKAFRERETTKQAEQQQKALEGQTEALNYDKHSLVLGNPDGDVTVVAFKDYRCGYCKKSWATVQELLSKDKQVRFVFKEFPVLGPQSELASRYALASSVQGKEEYKTYNDALMKHRGPWDKKTLQEIAKSHKIDSKQLEKDAGGKFVSDAIAANMKLGKALAIGGTPAFVIGKQLIPGAVPLEYLQDTIKKIRAEKK